MERLTRKEFAKQFKELEPFFDKFCEEFPEYDKTEMVTEIIKGDCAVWACKEGFILGRPQKYHNKLNFRIEALCGENMPSWIELSSLEQDVRDWGFSEIEFTGRVGWRREAAKQGYELNKVIMRKEI